jgi:hypothetical protein
VEARIVERAAGSGRFEVRIEGEGIQPGKLAIRDLDKLAPLLQAGLERTARVLRREPGSAPGPLPRDIQLATDLLLVGIEAGSANLVLELPVPEEAEEQEGLFPLPPRDLGQRAMDAFVRGLHELERGAAEVPDDWDNAVMEIAEDLATFSTERDVIIEVSSETSGHRTQKARLSPTSRDRFRVRHAPVRRPRAARGKLFLVDLKAGRIDVEDEKGRRVQCHFPAELEGQVKRLVGEIVLVSGEEEVDLAVSRPGRVEILSLEPAGEEVSLAGDFWLNRSAAEQTRNQGVVPISSVTDLAAAEDFDEGELELFIETIREGRREA